VRIEIEWTFLKLKFVQKNAVVDVDERCIMQVIQSAWIGIRCPIWHWTRSSGFFSS